MDFNQFNQSNNQKKKRKAVSTDNFIEALKGIGGGVAQGITKDVIAGSAKTAVDTLVRPQSHSGDLEPGASIEFDQLQQEQVEKALQTEHRRLHVLRQKEETIFSVKQEQTKNEITQLQEELKKFAQEVGDVAREVQVATLQESVDPGKYHVGFFEHLRNLIKALRQKISESASWLKAANDRSERKKGYWGQFKKQGTKFSLSEERKTATQSG